MILKSSQTTISLLNPNGWELASIPQKQSRLFPEASLNSIETGFNRALLAWYTVDPLFTSDSDSRTPDNIKDDKNLQSGQFVRSIPVDEVFPNIQLEPSQPRNLQVLDLAFYPDERGPYNYVVRDEAAVADGMTSEGKLENPQSRWGVMRELNSTNFEEQNIEFVQFWMLNPFYNPEGNVDAPSEGGDFYINLGSISEDILKDGQLAIENGVPADGDLSKLDSTYWGYVPNVRPVVTTFDNDPDARARQDVGYDLLDDGQEANWQHPGQAASYLQRIINEFGQTSGAYLQASGDPSNDNFRYFRSTALDQANADILERYKGYNNPDGNSNTTQVNGITAQSTNQPDVEDINRDQTQSKTETYYQYRISIRPEDLGPENIGSNYITDVYRTQSATQPNGEVLPAEWIQFKVPVFSPDKKVRPISDFRSIRFMRMFMQGFSQPLVMRFARLELVRGEWRRFTGDLDGFGDELNNDQGDNTLFEVNAVNIEQNGTRDPIPYVLPPGIDRQVLFGTTAATQQNEQSLSLRVCNLKDGSARAVFRNLDFDMRLYKRLKMFVHMEDGDLPDDIADGDLNVFLRMGSDYNQNYYEYELPLKKTPFNSDLPSEIWPEENELDFALDMLKEVKLERQSAAGGSQSITDRFSVQRGPATVSVVGAPNLGNVRTIMIGVRNPKKKFAGDGDDGQPKCAEVWVNELRLTEFDQRGGWAANARVAAQLADFANVSVSGRMSTVGFGSIDQRVNERQKEEIMAYDFQSSLELGKFFPKDIGLRIPMYFSNAEEWKNPQFDPLNPDIEFDDALANLEEQEDRDELKDISQDYTRRRSLNFTNVRKERTGEKARKAPMPYDIENFSASYSFNEIYRKNISIQEDSRRDYSGSLNYNFRTTPKPVEPFKNAQWARNEFLGLIRDINFNPYPRGFSAIASMDRTVNTVQMRNTAQFLYPTLDFPDLPVTQNNSFNFNRKYSLLWDLTKSLKLDFNANMRTRIDELIDTNEVGVAPDFTDQEKRDEIWDNLADFGRPINYHQTLNLNWQVPIDKLPYMDFTNVQARYTGDYDWQSNSQVALNRDPGDSLNFGNTIQNNRQIQFNGTLNFIALYNKVPYLKKANSGGNNARNDRRNRTMRRPGRNEEDADDEEDEEEEETTFDKILAGTARVLMMIRNANANYTRSEGTILPGFAPNPVFLGMDTHTGNAPGFLFTLGDQSGIRSTAADKGWLVRSEYLNNQYTETFSENITYRVTAEPAQNFRIVFTGSKNRSSNLTEFYRFDGDVEDWVSQNTFETFNYTVSHFMMPTAFEKLEGPGYASATYQQFLDYRLDVSESLARDFEQNRDQQLMEIFPDYSPDLCRQS
ncbi:MAG: cell surface protein SprA [Owenweeksia sp.]|nr:cell surface protein SprA [Owenweeksia sp.]